MAWNIYLENIDERLAQRLESGLYHGHDHPYLESNFVIPLLNVFPHEKICLAEYKEDDEIICAYVVSIGSLFSAAAYVDGVSQISLCYIHPSINASKFSNITQLLFGALPGYVGVFHLELIDPDLISKDIFSNNHLAEVEECANNTSLPAGVEFEQYWQERSKSVRKQTNRCIRSLERDGVTVDYCAIDDISRFEESFGEYCRIEGLGWKGEQGTALTLTNEQGIFYKRVVKGFMQQGRAKIHQLKFDGEVVASLISINNASMMIVVKTTYDENFAKNSPGRLLDYYMLQQELVSDNVKNMENYTNASEQDQKWFPRVRKMYNVTIYRNSWIKRAAQLKQKFL